MIHPIIYPYYVAASLKRSYSETVSLAAGGQATLDSTQITTAKTGKLLYFKVSGSVAFKVELFTVENGVASSVILDDFAWNGRFEWRTPEPNLITQAQVTGAAFDGFRVVIMNLDISLSADFSVIFVWDER